MPKPPLLLGVPIPLPTNFQGDVAGASVQYNLDHVLEFPWTEADVMRAPLARQHDLDARAGGLPAGTDESEAAEATRRAFNAEQRACNRLWAATRAAYLVHNFVGGMDLPTAPQPVEWWEAAPALAQWLAQAGLQIAMEQVASPFLATASPGSPPTAN